ncbi:DUF6268 family outer membrane beta-barrel protein [Flavobacterium hydatis]|uniref:DUF6268 domain-containing protein n=1 Tax=Flavobacterium hydatis TaxID=991 RepID=A0A086AT28_FLAHY|nr:DUF6268 family outer membrane beta-barrel protein [Flavobacterium hydatis]KFF19842.1 hypothetical protein IW20_01555 [Flavobacterium hydatis]OXA91591.1 hypothetical protein B0A62_18140 [Flavobacterium hydatis]
MKIKTLLSLLIMVPMFTIYAQNGYSVDLNIKTEPADKITLNETSIGILVYKNIDAKNKITNTLQYKNIGVKYDIENYAYKHSYNPYNSIKNTLLVAHLLTSKTTLNLELEPTLNFQENLNLSDLSILGGLEINQVINKNNIVSFGIKRTNALGLPQIIPTFSFYHKINDVAKMTIGFPNTAISYSNNERNVFSLTNSFNGDFFNLDNTKYLDDNTATKASLSQITTALEYERNMDGNWFVNFKAGYDFNKKYQLSNHDTDNVYDFNIGNSYILNIGIKYKH